MIRRFDLSRRQDPTRTQRGKFDSRFERFLGQFCELTGLEAHESAIREFARFTGDPGSVSLGLVRVAEAAQERGDALESEDVGAGRQRGEAVELGLYRWRGGRRVVGHS